MLDLSQSEHNQTPKKNSNFLEYKIQLKGELKLNFKLVLLTNL